MGKFKLHDDISRPISLVQPIGFGHDSHWLG